MEVTQDVEVFAVGSEAEVPSVRESAEEVVTEVRQVLDRESIL